MVALSCIGLEGLSVFVNILTARIISIKFPQASHFLTFAIILPSLYDRTAIDATAEEYLHALARLELCHTQAQRVSQLPYIFI